MNRSFKVTLLTILISAVPQISFAVNPPALRQELKVRLQRLHSNPRQAMQDIPTKYSIRPQIEILTNSRDRAFVLKKHTVRLNEICSSTSNDGCYRAQQQAGRAAAQGNDRPENLVDQTVKFEKSLTSIDAAGLHAARIAQPQQPWSDTYWPIYQGVLGARYASDTFNGDGSQWDSFLAVIMNQGQKLSEVFDAKTAVDELSPSEKYDLLVGTNQMNDGDKSFIAQKYGWTTQTVPEGMLTPHQWGEGKSYFESKGSVETWMGICHGWAPAAYLVQRPSRSVKVKAFDDQRTEITFYPSDIKALNSYYWAKANAPTKFVGGRCNAKDPALDPETGRVTDQDCFDTNPSTWHLAIIHQIAKEKRSFVFDATYDYEVWNQPVLGYTFQYFDPTEDGQGDPRTSTRWQDVAKDRTDAAWVAKDKFKNFRTKNGATNYYTKVVGVIMDVEYLVETNASTNPTDSPDQDGTRNVRYVYDLEIDSNGNAVGGEWYSNAHPDFIWNIPQSVVTNRETYSSQDRALRTNWDGVTPLPADWSQKGYEAAVENRMPLARIVEVLNARSAGAGTRGRRTTPR